MADASPTYRGYRKQCLYILWRVLLDDKELIYIPEHIEDLAIFRRDITAPEKPFSDSDIKN